jgi:F-type H+-transporting ATPase subunit epsilon
MARSFQVDVVSPEATVWSGEAEFVIARTPDGEIGIMAGHEPLMGALETGAVVVDSGNQRTTIGVHGGFIQILDDQVTLLTDRATVAEGGRDEAVRLAGELAEAEEAAQADEAEGASTTP